MFGDCDYCGHSAAYHMPFAGCMKCSCDEFSIHRVSALLLVVALVSCTLVAGPPPATPPTCTSGQHSWNGYHLGHTDLEPVVANNSGYLPDLGAWNALGTVIQLRPAGTGFAITIEEGGDADSPWLGLASIQLGGGGHIVRATVTMNRTLLDRYPKAVADHVLCQELGHLLGLDHQRQADDSCMDDCQGRGSGWLACLSSEEGKTPNAHDAEQLRDIYAHVEGPPVPPACAAGTVLEVHAFPTQHGDHQGVQL